MTALQACSLVIDRDTGHSQASQTAIIPDRSSIIQAPVEYILKQDMREIFLALQRVFPPYSSEFGAPGACQLGDS